MYLEQPLKIKPQLEKMGWLVRQHASGEEVILESKAASNVEEFSSSLLSHGFYVGSQQLAPSQHDLPTTWQAFAQTWQQLPTDVYMKDRGTYRQRRYSTLYYSQSERRVVRKPYMPLYKSSLYNHFAGDLFRYFEMTDASLFANKHFSRALSLALSTFNRCEMALGDGKPQWFIEVDQYRIVANPDALGKPTPEGTHSDGTSYFLLMLVERHNIEGGVSSIYDQNLTPVASTTLRYPGDMMLLDDARMLHGVTDISCGEGAGHRDILHLSFTNLNSRSAITRRFGLTDDEFVAAAEVGQWR